MLTLGILLFTLVVCGSSGDLGDRCGKNMDGSCILVSHCKFATDILKKRRPHGLQRCGFQDKEEIVCCPESSIGLKNPEKLRKSVVACESFNAGVFGIPLEPFILGGDNATLGEFPHMAALGYEDETRDDYNFECGGSLISESYVLTAAHCIIRADNKQPKMVRLGTVDLQGTAEGVEPQDVPVLEARAHDDYVWKDSINDIALLRLNRSVTMGQYVKPICLHTEDDDPSELLVAGWGKTGNTREGSRFLLKTYLSPVSLRECNITFGTRTFGKPIFDTQLCAKSNDTTIRRDTCQGDSGGPMQVEDKKVNGQITLATLVGVTSYGPLCGGNYPSIYTRVSKYLDWIERIVWP